MIECFLSFNPHNFGNFHPNEENKTSKSELGLIYSKQNIFKKAKIKAFVLLLIKCRLVLGTHS